MIKPVFWLTLIIVGVLAFYVGFFLGRNQVDLNSGRAALSPTPTVSNPLGGVKTNPLEDIKLNPFE